MKQRTPTRHKPEEIKNALAQLGTGKPLSEVAKQIGVSKSLIVYWRDHAEPLDSKQSRVPALRKQNERTRKFIERCWTSITLAFRKLDDELKKEKPAGIRDLALAIAVLADKMSQASQNLHTQTAPSSSEWAVTEDTLMIMRRHKEAKTAQPLAEKITEGNLEASILELQKRAEDAGREPRSSPDDSTQTTQPVKDGGN
jgi:hypothetical protein